MILRELLREMLASTAGVTDVVGQKYFTMRAPQGTAAPYLVVWIPAHVRIGHLRGTTEMENATVRFDLFGDNYMQLEMLRDTLIAMMDAALKFSSVYKLGAELYEDDTRLYHLVADFSVWHYRG